MLDPEDYGGEDDDSYDHKSMDIDFIVPPVCSGVMEEVPLYM